MTHQSKDDKNAHYSVRDEIAEGSKVKGGHVSEDASKQTVDSLLESLAWTLQLSIGYSKPTRYVLCERIVYDADLYCSSREVCSRNTEYCLLLRR